MDGRSFGEKERVDLVRARGSVEVAAAAGCNDPGMSGVDEEVFEADHKMGRAGSRILEKEEELRSKAPRLTKTREAEQVAAGLRRRRKKGQ